MNNVAFTCGVLLVAGLVGMCGLGCQEPDISLFPEEEFYTYTSQAGLHGQGYVYWNEVGCLGYYSNSGGLILDRDSVYYVTKHWSGKPRKPYFEVYGPSRKKAHVDQLRKLLSNTSCINDSDSLEYHGSTGLSKFALSYRGQMVNHDDYKLGDRTAHDLGRPEQTDDTGVETEEDEVDKEAFLDDEDDEDSFSDDEKKPASPALQERFKNLVQWDRDIQHLADDVFFYCRSHSKVQSYRVEGSETSTTLVHVQEEQMAKATEAFRRRGSAQDIFNELKKRNIKPTRMLIVYPTGTYFYTYGDTLGRPIRVLFSCDKGIYGLSFTNGWKDHLLTGPDNDPKIKQRFDELFGEPALQESLQGVTKTPGELTAPIYMFDHGRETVYDAGILKDVSGELLFGEYRNSWKIRKQPAQSAHTNHADRLRIARFIRTVNALYDDIGVDMIKYSPTLLVPPLKSAAFKTSYLSQSKHHLFSYRIDDPKVLNALYTAWLADEKGKRVKKVEYGSFPPEFVLKDHQGRMVHIVIQNKTWGNTPCGDGYLNYQRTLDVLEKALEEGKMKPVKLKNVNQRTRYINRYMVGLENTE
jgi:hypothetical protein